MNNTSLEKLTEDILLEKTRQELINKSRNADNYTSKGREGQNRYTRRLKSQISNSVRDYNRIDMDAFWKGDILDFGVRVQGETNNYIVQITFENILDELQREVKANNNKLEFKCVLRALISSFNSDNVYISCSCLHPSTKIKLLDGTNPTVEELEKRFNAGEKLYAYSADAKGDFKPGEIEKVWVTKRTTEFIKVTLDNGEEIITTPDHLYMLRDGTYRCAEDLVEGQSLMPMYFNEANGYTLVKLNSMVRGWKSVYKEVANYYKEDEISQAIDDNVELNEENYNIYRQKNRSSKVEKVFNSFNEMISEFNLNHKIVKIERITLEETPVYDIKVKDWENFVVDAGVVLHNCPDWKYRMAYFATKGQYNSGEPEVRPSDITNPRDSKGAGCKHSLLVISNLDWMMKIASVINNYIKYCKENMQRNYADYIFPKVYGVPYKKAVQLSLFDKEDKYGDGILPSDQKTLDDVIARSLHGKDEKGRWQSGNEYRFQKQEREPTNSQEEENALNLKFEREPEETDKEKNLRFTTRPQEENTEEDKEANIKFEK